MESNNWIENSNLLGGMIHKIVLKKIRYGDQVISEFNDNLFNISKSLRYRSRSVIFHAKSIENQLNHINNILQNDLNEKLKNKKFPEFHSQSDNSTEIMLFLLDDQIFSSASYFDYLAKFICVIFSDKYERWDWKNLIKEIEKQNNDIEDSIKNLMIIENNKLVKPLNTHRSNIIHNIMDQTEAREEFEWKPNSLSRKLSPKIPRYFMDQFIDFRDIYSEKDASIIDASKWLIESFFKTNSIIIKALFDRFVNFKQ